MEEKKRWKEWADALRQEMMTSLTADVDKSVDDIIAATATTKAEKTVRSERFWLACQAWYSEYEILFDDISAYTSWRDDENRIGVCQPLDAGKRDQIDERLRTLELGIESQGYLLMDPSWNNEKILFVDDEHYYLYYWWTGE